MTVYRVLPTHLHGTADAAAKYLTRELGLSANAIKIEQEVHPSVDFRPTIQALSSDKHLICVEVVEALFPTELQAFILSCRNHSVPVKLYCAIPDGSHSEVSTKSLQFASENGIAILEINPQSANGKILNSPPISLSLGGLRSYRLTDYPKKYREPLKQAIETFRSGNPSKGCAQVYDEIEQLSRRIGRKVSTITGGLSHAAGFDWNTVQWNNLLEFLKKNLQPSVVGCPELRPQLLSRLVGMTEYRNEAGHKPASLQKLMDRDRSLKTRFESAMDELLKLIEASKALKV
ncbi:MAG: hypothetical protein ACOZJZ_13185 [Pseudomonadota bacterium]